MGFGVLVIMVIIVMVLKSWSVLVAFLGVVELAIVVIIECWGSMWFGKNFFNDRSSIGLKSVMEKMVAVGILGLWDGF